MGYSFSALLTFASSTLHACASLPSPFTFNYFSLSKKGWLDL
jgi:hypothetical protein